MKKLRIKWILLIVSMFILLLSSTFISIYLVNEIKGYNKIINNVGRIRGLSQRIIKLETNNLPYDYQLDQLNSTLNYLKYSPGNIGDDEQFMSRIKYLDTKWIDLNKEMIFYDENPLNRVILLQKSEDLYEAADKVVNFIEDYSNKKILGVIISFGLVTLFTIVSWLLIIIFYLKYLNNLQIMNAELEKKAYTDPLTHANNFDKFLIEAEFLLSKCNEYAIFYCDIENFKYINDVFGYSVGDDVLKYLSKSIQEEIGINDTYARLSADNFIILKSFNNKEELSESFVRISEKLSSYDEMVTRNYKVTLCTGIFCVEDMVGVLTVNEMIDRANYAQNTIKSLSNNNYAFYNEKMRNQIIYQKKIETDMEEALKNDEFVFYLQPKISLLTDEVAGAEALVRWNAKEKFISPNEFIPLFEKNLFIIQLDQYIFEQVCTKIRSWLDKGIELVPISVNVSKVQFYNPDFVKVYAFIKDEHNIPDNIIEIEFTESVMFENTDTMLKIIYDLHKNGFYCAIDDFGSGYSSLNLLKNISVDVLKLDRMFFYRSENERKEKIVVQSIIQMAKNLNIITVAEGIESWEQVKFLREIGCDMIQGYIYSKPMTSEDFECKYLNL